MALRSWTDDDEQELNKQFKFPETFNVFKVLQVSADLFKKRPFSADLKKSVSRNFRKLSLTAHPDRRKDTSGEKYTFQYLNYAHCALVKDWTDSEIEHAARRFRCDAPQRLPREEPQPSPRDRAQSPSPFQERERRPYSFVDLTRSASPSPTSGGTTRKRPADGESPSRKRQRTLEKVNISIDRILVTPTKKTEGRKTTEYTRTRSDAGSRWNCGSGAFRIKLDAKDLLSADRLRSPDLMIRVWVNTEYTISMSYCRKEKAFVGYEKIDWRKLSVGEDVMRAMVKSRAEAGVGYMS